MITHKKLDYSYVVFALLGFFLLASFWYSIEIEKTSKIKYTNMGKVESLILLNQKIDTFLKKKLKHENFDVVSKNIIEFEVILQSLGSSNLETMRDTNIVNRILEINQKFLDKKKVVENFKSYSGLFITSVHYMLSLNNFIQKRYYFSPILTKTQEISLSFTQSLFENGDLYEIKRSISELDNLFKSNKLADEQIKTFIEHSNLALNNIEKLNQLIKEKDDINLKNSLVSLKVIMNNNFKASTKKEKLLQYMLFIVDFMILMFLVRTYRYMRIKEQELFRFNKAVENSDNSIVITNKDHVITYVNDTFVKVTGYEKNEAIGNKPNILKSGKMSKEFYKELNYKLSNNQRWEGEFINRKKDGSFYNEAASIVPMLKDSEIEGYMSIKLNITNYIRQKEELIHKTNKLDEAQKIAQIGHWEFYIKLGKISVSNEVMRIFEFDVLDEDISFKEFIKFIHQEDKTRVIVAFRKHIDSEFNKNLEFRIVTIKEKVKHLQVRLHKKFDNQGNLIALTGTIQDISKLVLAREEINYIAYHDNLTKLDNRIAFENKLEHAIYISKRKKTTLAVMFIDLDRFKVVNDTLGHQVGDKLLTVISDRLKEVIRESDTLARLGGDEFGLFLETTNKAEEVTIVANKILQAVAKPVNFDNYTLNVTSSIGISFYPDNGNDTETLLKNADSAMYLAKDMGKNNFQFFTEILSKEVNRRYYIENEMREAIKNEEFELVYQPQYDLIDKKVVGCEALLRWKNKNLGQLSPVEFIPVAEESGMIVVIGEWVLREACLTYKKLEKLGIAPKIFCVNVSSVQFRQGNIIKTFTDVIKEVGVSPSSIEIEITESYLVESNEQNLTVLDDFRKIGFRISVDDFGTGYSSMSYLKNLPLDTLKIDKSFIKDIPNNNDDVSVTKAIITLAKSFGYLIIAEGIETKEQEDFLADQKCEIGQGYLFSKPLPINKLIDFLS